MKQRGGDKVLLRDKMRPTEGREEIDEGNGEQRMRGGEWMDG